MVHVPYKGSGPAMTDLLGGQVDMIFGTAAGVAAFVSQGLARAGRDFARAARPR